MQKTPPPIQWLPILEAAARHLSFKKAAEELCVTPSAISQQIKGLENYLGLTLFERNGRKLKLSPAGESYYLIAEDIIKRHSKGYRELQRRYHNPVLQISCPIFIAQELLIPNYLSFKEFAPSVELRITTGNAFVDFDNEPVDAALRFGPGSWPELDCRLISDVDLQLVCSPTYLDQYRLNKHVNLDQAALEGHALISLDDELRNWKQLYPTINPEKTIICDSYFSAIRSAEEGLGITVGMKPTINRLLAEERLITLTSDISTTDFAYWLVAPKHKANTEQVDALHRWIKSLFDAL
ncbi:LysR substrate-binding domain-containing protein [Aestuariirhabdus sp. Z084]|uniref:LysR substrate-binding domain-containing protein n=1 Tax=Aestuariirhabdus haliotis TaxID=2918751 RepID=UPI00201B4187|nr:LysR substrate-binding domain-containing protein [Aestuariirhabdus haliotis]MCL6417348.1 LysR substrate-binding domain-containing protein [Aestuariirhabdus haliotis]MCL6421293.1 LysR substrate-binding domain-containing protein [Aestuariirhabdus haliotis]